MNVKTLKMTLAGFILSVSGLANAALITEEFTGGTASTEVGSDYASSGLIFDNAYYSNCYGSGWISGENDTCYNSNFDNAIDGGFSGTTDFISAILKYPDGGVTSLLEVFDINNVLLSSTSVTGGDTFISLAQNGISSFRFSWSSDDVVGLESISFNEITSAPVPEPSTLAIFALGIMGLASRRFKKQ